MEQSIRSMRPYLCGTVIALFLMFVFSFGNEREKIKDLEDRDFLLFGMVALDEKGSLLLSGSVANQDENSKEKAFTCSGINLSNLKENYSLSHAGRLDFGHMKVLLIDQSFMDNKEALVHFLYQCKEDPTLSKTLLVCESSLSDKEIQRANERKEEGLAKILHDILNKEEKPSTVFSLYRDLLKGDYIHLTNVDEIILDR